MNVKELKDALSEYPDDMVVIFPDYSEVEGVGEIEAVNQNDYVMRTHPTMSDDNKRRVAKFLLIG